MSRSLEPAQGMAAIVASIVVAAAAGNAQRVKKPVLVHSALASGGLCHEPAGRPAGLRARRTARRTGEPNIFR